MTRARLVVVVVLALVATGLGLAAPLLASPSAKDRIAADPPPRLFPAATAARVDSLVLPESRKAHRRMTAWWSAHGRSRDDVAFVAWVGRTFPAPPSTSTRAAELAEVRRLDRERTPAGVRAASWLEAYGKKDLWKLYVHDQAELLPTPSGDRRKQAEKDLLKMSKSIADTLGARFRQSAPYVLEPGLRPDHHVTAGQVCPCSYPSRHASAAAASRTFLGGLMPARAEEYRATENQVDYSRIYMAGHVPSDIAGGALLGDMIGEYLLVTRDHVDPAGLTSTS